MIDLNELNESQRAAVLYCDGPSLVIAGAGSGKTRVLTYKIAYLLDQGYEPWSVLALTFTNKAAREMKERIARQVGAERARSLWMGTFHSVFSRILRTEAEVIGFPPHFTIYDASDSKNLIKAIVKEMGLDEKVYKPATVQSRISQAKNRLVSPEAYAACRDLVEADQSAKIPQVRDIYLRYRERCRQSGAMDFDDLLVYTYLLFKQHPEVCRRYAERFKYILVDEYQDTNFAQHSIVLQLTGEHRRVCVVGDDAQSIYSFRGANIDNILTFTRLYSDARLFKLEQNYRSTQTIVKAANSLIAKNRQQIRKEVFSENDAGEPIEVMRAYSDVEEGEMVANKLVQLHLRANDAYDRFAILYRTNAQSRIFEEALRKRMVPYRIYGGLSFYQRKEVKDVIAYFRLAVNPADEEAFKRVLNYPARGIGDTTLAKLMAAASQAKVSLWTVLCEPMAYGLSINKGTHTKLQNFRALIQQFIDGAGQKDAFEIGHEVVRLSGIMADITQDRSPENLSRQENVEELINGMKDFCDTRREEGNTHVYLTDYLQEVALLTDQDSRDDDDQPKVTLMTVHAAKGLEFKNVFVVGMEDGLFPSMMSDSPRALEEERRLFYVALTRAEEHCYLSYAKSRFKFGRTEFGRPSRFLQDIDSRYLRLPQGEALARRVDEGAGRFRKDALEGGLFGGASSSSADGERNYGGSSQGSASHGGSGASYGGSSQGSASYGGSGASYGGSSQGSASHGGSGASYGGSSYGSSSHGGSGASYGGSSQGSASHGGSGASYGGSSYGRSSQGAGRRSYGGGSASSYGSSRSYERSYERDPRDQGPSMFDGGEIPQEPHRFVKPAAPRTLRKVSSAVSSSGVGGSAPVSAGQQIEHERFGRGEIIRVDGTGDNCKATVRFEHAGEKQLLLKFARFKVVDEAGC